MAEHLELPAEAASVAIARRWAAQTLEPHGADLAATVSLLVSELVTNVVLHARTTCTLALTLGEDAVRVEVTDGSDRMPAASRVPDPLALSGRGMVLIESLSSRTGAEPRAEGGKVVWFEVPRAEGRG